MSFARNAFATSGSTSWADDDDFDDAPIPLATPTLPKVEENEPKSVRSPRGAPRSSDHQQRRRDYDGQGGRRDYGGRDRPRRHEYGHREDRGQHHHSDRRRGGEYDHEPREQRPKNPVPDVAPFKIYFGNLPFHATEDDIAHFIGDIDSINTISLPFDRANGRIKGFAYVDFRSRDALVQALTLDGKDFDGRAVNIDVATERKPRQNDSFYEKRSNTRGYDREEAPKERPRLAIKPRTTSTDKDEHSGEAPSSTKPNPFGEAKARDENAYLERRKSKELEEAASKLAKTTLTNTRDRKQSQDGEGGPVDGGRGGRGRGGRGGRDTDGGRWERDPHAGGRGRGRGDGGKQSESVPEGEGGDEEREGAGAGGRGGRGRGQESGRGSGRRASHGGRTSERVEAPAPATAPTPIKKEIKQREPPKVNVKLSGTTTKNLFASLNDDSDSDSD